MKTILRMRAVLAVLLGLASGAALAGDWVLALSWAPGFCAGHPQKRQCEQLNRQGDEDAGYARSQLTLHGLWPQRQDCHAPPLHDSDLPPALSRYMPGVADGLAVHEWSKHGGCSGYTARGYFEQMIAMAQQAADSALGRYLHAHAGGRVTLSALHAASLPDYHAAGAESVRFICRGERLEEVRISLRDWSQTLLAAHPDASLRPSADADRCDDSILL